MPFLKKLYLRMPWWWHVSLILLQNDQYHATGHYDHFGIIFVTSVPFKKEQLYLRIQWWTSLLESCGQIVYGLLLNFICRILNAYAKVPPKPKAPSTKRSITCFQCLGFNHFHSFLWIMYYQLCWSFFHGHSEFEELEPPPASAAIDGPLEPPPASAAVVLGTPKESLINYFSVC